jgi:hypothetical protein
MGKKDRMKNQERKRNSEDEGKRLRKKIEQKNDVCHDYSKIITQE